MPNGANCIEKTIIELLLDYSKKFKVPFPITYMGGTSNEIVKERIINCLENNKMYDLGNHIVKKQEINKEINYNDIINKIIKSMDDMNYNYKQLLEEQLNPINERKKGKVFSFEEHLEALILTFLNNHRWGDKNLKKNLSNIRKIFGDFKSDYLKKTNPDDLYRKIIEIDCGNITLARQLKSLKHNVMMLEKIRDVYGDLDTFVTSDKPGIIAKYLCDGKYKLEQIGPSFALEYLRRVGIETCKIDSQTKRLFGSNRLAFTRGANATTLQAINIIKKLSEDSNLTEFEIDSILWQFCTKWGSYICSEMPKCRKCKLRDICNYNKYQ